MNNIISSNWVNWANENRCPLCDREGDNIANVWKKGHLRSSGIMLEWGLSYCKDCAKTQESENHWKKS